MRSILSSSFRGGGSPQHNEDALVLRNGQCWALDDACPPSAVGEVLGIREGTSLISMIEWVRTPEKEEGAGAFYEMAPGCQLRGAGSSMQVEWDDFQRLCHRQVFFQPMTPVVENEQERGRYRYRYEGAVERVCPVKVMKEARRQTELERVVAQIPDGAERITSDGSYAMTGSPLNLLMGEG